MSYAMFRDAAGTLPFLVERSRYFRTLRPAGAADRQVNDLCASLRRDGIAFVPGFIPGDTASRMLAQAPAAASLEESVEGDKALFLRDAHRLPAFSEFFEHPLLRSVASAYIDEDVMPLRQVYEHRRSRGTVLACDRMYHMDSWKHRLKAFLYLHDVGEAQAPMSYVRGSHEGAWRRPMEARIRRLYKVNDSGYAASQSLAYVGCYWPYEVDDLKRRHGLSEVVCTGAAGTLVFFDARGLHKANELHSEGRQILISYWVRRNHHT